MVATLWLLSLLTITLITASECVYAPSPLAKYRRLDNTPYGFRDDLLPIKRTKLSLSIVNPLDVLRQRLMLESLRRSQYENDKQIIKNREILERIGKRSSGNEPSNFHERERFEPFRQHLDMNAILDEITGAAQSNDHSIYSAQSPDYYFDETNTIDTKQMLTPRLHSFRSSASRPYDIEASANSFATDENGWREEKQQSLHNQKQQPLNGPKSHYIRQWNQQINEKMDPNVQQQQQQKQPIKTNDNNGDFMQSFDLN
ncbi:uncharacterized protein LOC116350678 isoform X2 [Contarinia nasturtii]|nr:uncharacterized protein LOC116350678 isoform X2 [Contarinia nasturtii]XP_031638423.1 uncharacterized protein LOC116350678 isoform X2 [Contarinia nasturtii]XP_031638424.1 uncharacterized protein LOC116350678 isoform X2 [Contarinia nasturtii]